MGIEWFRDLSITILGFVMTGVLIFIALLVYRLYRTTKSTLLLIKATSKIAYDTVSLVQEGIRPLLSIITFIQGLRGGLQGISKIFQNENNQGGNRNE
jgi:hypothetical protein